MANLSISHLASQEKYSHYLLYTRDSRNKVLMNHTNVLAFLENRGYFLFRPTPVKHIFIRIVQNIVKEVGKKDLIDEVMYFIRHDKDTGSGIFEAFAANTGKWFTEMFFLLLSERKVEIKRDLKTVMQFYFQNCIVKVHKDKVTTHPYTELNGLIWESQIIQREFTEITIDPEFEWSVFINRICSFSPERITSLCSVFGFLLHNYKNPSYCPAIILNDEVISDNPEGGTGKGLIAKAIRKFRNTVVLEGKNFDFGKTFLYQRVNPDTQIVFFDDVKKSFDFERLFSIITEGIPIELKGLREQYIEFEESPKILVSTNYAIKGSGNSHERRRHDVEISQWYTKQRSPEMEFGRMFFNEWEVKDWQQFDNYMVMCAQIFLQNGLIEQDLINLPEKRLQLETNNDFLEFMVGFEFVTTNTSDWYDKFINLYDEYKQNKWFNKKIFGIWMSKYADAHGWKMESKVNNSIRYYMFEKRESTHNI